MFLFFFWVPPHRDVWPKKCCNFVLLIEFLPRICSPFGRGCITQRGSDDSARRMTIPREGVGGENRGVPCFLLESGCRLVWGGKRERREPRIDSMPGLIETGHVGRTSSAQSKSLRACPMSPYSTFIDPG